MSDVPVRLLRDALREGADEAPSSACLDADAVAALCDGALSAPERAAAEAHAAGCGRCQALVATMARITPAPSRSTWRVPTFRWLVPLAAGAAAVALWIAVPRPSLERPAVPASTVAAAPSPSREQLPNRTDLPIIGGAVNRNAPPAPDDQRRAKAEPRPEPLPLPAPRPVAADALVASPPPPPASPDEPAAPTVTANAPARPAPRAETIGGTANASDLTMSRSSRAAGAAPAQAFAKATAAPRPEIVSPDRAVRWRITSPASIERTIDGGATWQAQSTGVGTPLVSGAAPAPTICWLVGNGGVVLRSTDGTTWKRLPFPEAIDLRSILATDAAIATVTAADGRRFVTADGGATWTRAF